MRIRIGVRVIGRVETLAQFSVDRTIYGGSQTQTREILFKELDSLLREVHQATAIRANTKLRPDDDENDAAGTEHRRGGKDRSSPVSHRQDEEPVLTEPLPTPPQGVSWEEFIGMPPNYNGGPR